MKIFYLKEGDEIAAVDKNQLDPFGVMADNEKAGEHQNAETDINKNVSHGNHNKLFLAFHHSDENNQTNYYNNAVNNKWIHNLFENLFNNIIPIVKNIREAPAPAIRLPIDNLLAGSEIKSPITPEANQTFAKSIKYPESLSIWGEFSLDSIYGNNDNSQESAVNQSVDNDIVFVRISKITILPAEQVYDLSIEGTHNFVANGIIAHNTYITGGLGAGLVETTNGNITGTGRLSITSGDISGQISFNCANCAVKTDWRPRSARPQCNNSIDDDSDGKIDYPNDLGCSSLDDTDETDTFLGGNIIPPVEPIPTPAIESTPTPIPTLTPTPLLEETIKTITSNFKNITTQAKENYQQASQQINQTAKEVKKIVNTPAGEVTTKVAVTIPVIVSVSQGLAGSLLPAFSSLSDIYLIFLRLLGLISEAFGLKRKIKKWGIVYDSKTKRPLDPVYLKIINGAGEVVSERFTDMEGRFGFLVEPGRYRIRASKTHYAFPSRIKGERDELYDNLYFGETLDIKDTDVVKVNIPMDPIGIDWNEETKKKIMKFNPKREIIKRKISKSFLWEDLLLHR